MSLFKKLTINDLINIPSEDLAEMARIYKGVPMSSTIDHLNRRSRANAAIWMITKMALINPIAVSQILERLPASVLFDLIA